MPPRHFGFASSRSPAWRARWVGVPAGPPSPAAPGGLPAEGGRRRWPSAGPALRV